MNSYRPGAVEPPPFLDSLHAQLHAIEPRMQLRALGEFQASVGVMRDRIPSLQPMWDAVTAEITKARTEHVAAMSRDEFVANVRRLAPHLLNVQSDCDDEAVGGAVETPVEIDARHITEDARKRFITAAGITLFDEVLIPAEAVKRLKEDFDRLLITDGAALASEYAKLAAAAAAPAPQTMMRTPSV